MGWASALKARLTRTPDWPAPLPTADFYMLCGIGDRVAHVGATPSPERPIVRLGPNLWAHGDRAVIVRYVTDAELARLASNRWQSLHYLVDDLIPLAAVSRELPEDYRARLAAFATTCLPRLRALGPVIVAPSRAILDAFPDHRGELLDPCCLALVDGDLPPPTPWPGTPDAPIDIAFLGTRSHAGSLNLIDAIAEGLARRLSNARLTLFFGRHLPSPMASRSNVLNHPALSWRDWRAFASSARFHAAVAPVQPTPFATARSITKVMDHASVGAVGLYSARPPFADTITPGTDGVLIDSDDADAWVDALVTLACDPMRAEAIAAAGQRLARERGDPARLCRFWTERLGLQDMSGSRSQSLPRQQEEHAALRWPKASQDERP